MVTHGHILLNNKKHNIPSYFVQTGDVVELKKRLQTSPLYANAPVMGGNQVIPSRVKVNKKTYTVEVVDMPKQEEVSVPVDILKVIEFYARA